jgi:hypothetical protein
MQNYSNFGAIYVLLIAHCINFWTYMNLCVQDPGFIQKIVKIIFYIYRNMGIRLINNLLTYLKVKI